MVHERIRNPDLYQDRTVQDWHADTFPKDFDAIDLDLFGSCHNKFCRAPLYLIEGTTNPNKATSILEGLARAAHCPAFVIWHRDGVVTKGRQLYPQRGNVVAPSVLELAFRSIRESHVCESR